MVKFHQIVVNFFLIFVRLRIELVPHTNRKKQVAFSFFIFFSSYYEH